MKPISMSAMPAIDPRSPARGMTRFTQAPANESTNLSSPMTIMEAIPRCHVAIAAARSSRPPCLNRANAGPSTRSARPMVVGVSIPSGMAVTSSRPVRRARRTAIHV